MDTPAKWKEALRVNLWRVHDVVLPVIKNLQPLDTGYGVTAHSKTVHQGLAALDRLWVDDKHRTIPVVVTSVSLVSGLDKLSDEFRPHVIERKTRTSDPDAVLLAFEVAPGADVDRLRAEMDMHFQYAFEIAFDDTIEWLKGREAQEALTALYQITESAFASIVDAVEIHNLVPPPLEMFDRSPWWGIWKPLV